MLLSHSEQQQLGNNNKSMTKLKSLTKQHQKTLGTRIRPLHTLSFPLHGNQRGNNQIRASNKVVSTATRHHSPRLLSTISSTETDEISSHRGSTPLM